MSYFTSSSLTGGSQHEAKLHLYLHQNISGSNQNQKIAVNPGNKNYFALIAINDWTICEGRDAGSKVIARAQGMHTGCDQNKERWYCSFSIVFEDNSFKGSTLEVRGTWNTLSPFEWAIVGGTGEFTLAQGIVSGKTLSYETGSGRDRRIMELFIHIFYRTIDRPNMT